MSLVRLMALCVLFPALTQLSAWGLTLTKDGVTDYVIVPADPENAVQKNAANELRKYLKLVTGADLAIQSAGDAGPHRILVGLSEAAHGMAPDVAWEKLQPDSIVIKTHGDDLILAGGEPRGTLYAVYTFLEDVIGVRWWTSTEQFVPRKATLEINALNIVYTPGFVFREALYNDPTRHPDFAAKLKLNGHWNRIPPELGGHLEILGFCHTFYELLPPKTYFKEHPEWYSQIKGKRVAANAQLCLTNDEMRAELTRRALEWIKKNPHAGYISISQNDCLGPCECEKCQALEKQEQSPAGPLIHFVNRVAGDIAKEYPDIQVETLAYQYTRKPPAHVRPASNVRIRLCTFECMFNKPLTDPVNSAFAQDIRNWRNITPNLLVWDYVTNFTNYLSPHPNLNVLAPNLRFFKQYGVTGLFEQGDSACPMGDFVRLRAWLLAHLLWNPDADEGRLRHEFMAGYYGAAAEPLEEYLTLIQRAAQGARVGIYNLDYSFMTLQDMNQATQIMDRAARAVADDPVLATRVRRERLSLDSLWVLRYVWLKREAGLLGQPFNGPSDPVAFTETLIKALHEFGGENPQINEGGKSFKVYETIFRRLALLASLVEKPENVPEMCRSLAADDWWQMQDQDVKVLDNHDNIKSIADPLASDQSAIVMPGGVTVWYVQFHLPSDMVRVWKGPIHVYASVRVEAKSSDGTACTVGIHDSANKKSAVTKSLPIRQFADGAYHTIDLGEPKLSTDACFWIVPGSSENVRNIYIDRIWLIRSEKK